MRTIRLMVCQAAFLMNSRLSMQSINTGIILVDETPKEPKNEPLPPGVDPPELAYTLPTSALEACGLYGAQQTNPIYAATLAGAAAGIPLLSHTHTALMQGQLAMHYNPAYHQHLHNVTYLLFIYFAYCNKTIF